MPPRQPRLVAVPDGVFRVLMSVRPLYEQGTEGEEGVKRCCPAGCNLLTTC
jgi:hypothetical protein